MRNYFVWKINNIRKCVIRYIFIAVLFLVAQITFVHASTDSGYQSGSVLILCANSGIILYHTDGFSARYPASITKVMTALLVLENVEDLSETLTISARAANLPSYASRIGMVTGETMTILEALYGIMLPSANEVARALAEHVSGTFEDFVELMNQRLVELGAYHSNFINPCGLPGNGQRVIAYDMALVMREAVRHPVFVEIIQSPHFTIGRTNMYDSPRVIWNTNRMIRRGDSIFTPEIVGGKTGFTFAAQNTLVSYAVRGEFEIIIVTLLAPRGVTFTDTALLMDIGFDILAAQTAANNVVVEMERVMREHVPTIDINIGADNMDDDNVHVVFSGAITADEHRAIILAKARNTDAVPQDAYGQFTGIDNDDSGDDVSFEPLQFLPIATDLELFVTYDAGIYRNQAARQVLESEMHDGNGATTTSTVAVIVVVLGFLAGGVWLDKKSR